MSEVEHNAAADKNIVLAAFASIYVQLRNARPEIASFPSQDESFEDFHIKSDAGLEYSCRSSRFTRVRSPKEQGGAFTEMPQPAANTDPGRNTGIGKAVQSDSWSHEEREVLLRDYIPCGVQVFVGVYHERYF